LNRRHAIPFRETGRKLEIVAAASRNAAGRNQLNDFRIDPLAPRQRKLPRQRRWRDTQRRDARAIQIQSHQRLL